MFIINNKLPIWTPRMHYYFRCNRSLIELISYFEIILLFWDLILIDYYHNDQKVIINKTKIKMMMKWLEITLQILTRWVIYFFKTMFIVLNFIVFVWTNTFIHYILILNISFSFRLDEWFHLMFFSGFWFLVSRI